MPVFNTTNPLQYLDQSAADFTRRCASEELVRRIYALKPWVLRWMERNTPDEVICDFIDTSIGSILVGCPEPGWQPDLSDLEPSEVFSPWEL